MPADTPSSLAQRNLLRHLTFSLPSGQAVSRALRIQPLTPEELADVTEISSVLARRRPLWFYILREADSASWW
ncbi:MAG: hypothetical protein F6K56_10085 [Moorea sp. SIO3G5]|nr:hypothetical protein [Moorena sp. SIO3G5]